MPQSKIRSTMFYASLTVLFVSLVSLFILFACSVQPDQGAGGGGTGSSSSQEPDTNLPSVSITVPANNFATNGAGLAVEGTASIGGTNAIILVELSVEGSAFAAVSGTNTWSTNITLVEGTNGLVARAISGNNMTNTSSLVTVRLDTVNPVVNITSVTNNEEVGTTYELGGDLTESGSGAAHVYVRIDTGSWEEVSFNPANPYPWSSNISLAVYGFHTNFVYAVDAAGNTGATNAVIVNRAAIPSVIIFTPSSYLETNSNTVTISGDSGVDGASITNVLLSTNGAAYVSVATVSNFSVAWGGFSEGTNTVVAKVLSDNGKSNTSATRYFIVDLTAPGAPVVSGDNFTTDSTPTWTWASGGGGNGNYRYKLDDSNMTVGTTPTTSTNYTPGAPLSSGNHTLYVQERDNAGNWSSIGQKTTDVFAETVVHAATTGNDTNSGSSTSPFLTIQKAIIKAVQLGLTDVYVASGTYVRGAGLNALSNGIALSNNGIKLRGGYNSVTWTRGAGDYSVIDMEVTTSQRGFLVTNARDIVIDGFVVRNGNVPFALGYGGGLFVCKTSNVLITNSIISNNGADYGGGLYVYFCTNTVINATVFSNTCNYSGGGVMLNRGYANTVEGLVTNNRANIGGGVCTDAWADETNQNTITATVAGNRAYVYGGGLYINGYRNTVSGTIQGNTANRYGGGIYISLYGGNTTVDSDMICNNTALSNDGGGIYILTINNLKCTIDTVISNNTALANGGGIFTLTNTPDVAGRVIGNSANLGGGFYICNAAGSNTAEVCYNTANSGGGYYFLTNNGTNIFGTVHHNTATNEGGGLWITNAVSGVIPATVCWNASSNGGGIFLAGSSCGVSGNVCSNEATNGGGIFINGGRQTVSGNVYSNIATYGGGLYVSTGNRTIFSGTNYLNYALKSGGGIYLKYGMSNQITGLVFSNSVSNQFTYGSRGSGVCIDYSTNSIISGLLINNGTLNAPGGGIYVSLCSNTIISGTLSNNFSRNGGAVYVNMGYGLSFTGIASSNYSSANGNGGGLYLDSLSNASISGTIINNTAASGTSAGGGIYALAANAMYISNQTFISNNSSYTYGGGIFLESCNSVTISGQVLSNRVTGSATFSYGGGVYTSLCNLLDFRNFTNFGNSAYFGGGIYMTGGISNTFQSTVRVVSCRATNHPGVALNNENYFRLNAAYITNNYITGTGTNAALWLYNTGVTMTNLYINGAYLGVGNNTGTAYGIYEAGSADIVNHTITGIDFYTNNMTYLYHNYNSTNTAITNVAALNTTNVTVHGAASCSGNTVVAY